MSVRYLRMAVPAFTAFGLAMAAGGATADVWLPGFEGYSPSSSGPPPCPLCDSTVNFAVWQNATNGWTGDAPFSGRNIQALNTGFPGTIDDEAEYVYLYQVINTNRVDPEQALENFNISVEYKRGLAHPDASAVQNPFTSAGYIVDTVFENASENTDPDTPFDWEPFARQTVTPLGDDADAIEPTEALFDLMTNPQIDAIFGNVTPFPGVLYEFDNDIPIDGTSSLVWLTSDIAPSFVWAETESPGGSGEAMDVPGIKLPIPATVFLLGFGLAALGVLGRRSA